MIMELSACLLILPKKFHTAISSGSKLTMSVLASPPLLPPLFANITNSRTKALNREVIPEVVAYDSSRNNLLRLYICGYLFEADYILLHLVRYDRLWFR